MIDVCFEVPLAPEAHGRAMPISQRLRNGKTFTRMVTPGPTRRWQADLASIAAEYMPRQVLDEVLRVDILAVFQRPKSKEREGRGFLWNGSRPDADNVAKNVTDAMRSFWRDDCRIAVLTTSKAFAERGGRSRVLVRIRSLANAAPEEVVKAFGLPTDSELDQLDGPPDSDFLADDEEQPSLF